MPFDPQNPPHLMNQDEVARILGVSVRTVTRLGRRDPTFPRQVRFGLRIKYSRSAVVRWVEHVEAAGRYGPGPQSPAPPPPPVPPAPADDDGIPFDPPYVPAGTTLRARLTAALLAEKDRRLLRAANAVEAAGLPPMTLVRPESGAAGD